MTKAYSFIRFSSPAQMKGDSLRRQLAKAEKFAVERGLELDTSYRALGISAYRGKHRTKGALAAFLDGIKTGEIEAGSWLIVENVDRLSRETPWDAFVLFQEIINAGIVVATLMDDMIYDLPKLRKHPELLQTLNAAMTKGHRESRDKGERLGDAWEAKRADIIAGNTRRKLTRQGPGWLKLIADDPSDPLVGDWAFTDQASVVREAFALTIEGQGKNAIAQRLNDAGAKTMKHGDGWNASTVAMLLGDRRTIGELQLYSKVEGERRPVGEPIKGYFKPVIDEDTFYRAQAAIARRWCGAGAGDKGKVPNLFVGTGKCSCGRAMEYRDTNTAKRAWRDKAIFLRCSGAQRHHQCGNRHKFTYSVLERLILDWVTDIRVTDEEANKATVAAIKLDAKLAERDDLQRRAAEAMSKWEDERDDLLKTMLYRSLQRHTAAIPGVEADIAALETEVRTTKRSVVDDRRAAVRRVRDQLATLEGKPLFDVRAKLAAALRQVIDHIKFQHDGSYRVTLRGGLKLYHFDQAGFVAAHDLATLNDGGKDPLLTFPDADLAKTLAPMTLAGIRETLGGAGETVLA